MNSYRLHTVHSIGAEVHNHSLGGSWNQIILVHGTWLTVIEKHCSGTSKLGFYDYGIIRTSIGATLICSAY